MAVIMNTTEIESALANFETTYPTLCHRIELPEKTHGGRTCHALRIAKDYDPQRLAVLVIGGVHAREWGGPDIVVNFAGDLLRAYANATGLQYLNKTFSAGEIKTIFETVTVVVFPCVNPDGVEFSHTGTALWRKNRNPASSEGDPSKIGVDINRNYDFLWDYKTAFHPSAWSSSLASSNPLDETFHGPSPFSETETRNVKWLMDNLPTLALFLDLHSYTGDVLYSWGDDEDQDTDPAQSFTNPAYDGKRGVIGDTYREYLSAPDTQIATGVAQAVTDAMKAVRNQPYKAMQAVGLYPTSGTSDDYAFSRHIAQQGLAKTFGFTLEFNFEGDGFFATSDPTVLDNTMLDVIPGLIALCLAAQKTILIPPIYVGPQALNIIYLNPATGEVWYIGGDGKIHKIPPLPDPYRTRVANEIWRLVNAYEAISSIGGPAGQVARQGILKGIQDIAAGAAKPGAG